MNRKRIYIQKCACSPMLDMWLEVDRRDADDTEIRIVGTGEEGTETFVTLTTPSAIRLLKAINMILDSIEPLEANVFDEGADDKVSDH